MGISFLYPKFLFLLVLVPVFIIIYFFNLAYTKKKAVVFSNFEALEKISGIEFFSRNFAVLYLNLGILILIILAISGTVVSFNANSDSTAYIIAIDNSDSMKVQDASQMARLDAAEAYAKDFVNILPTGTNIGVISFSGDARIVHELDSSKIRVNAAIDSIDFSGNYGTNFYNALVNAGSLLESRDSKAVILISDGQFNVVELPDILSYAKKNSIVINSVVVGAEAGLNKELNATLSADMASLEALSANTGGKFFEAANGEFSQIAADSLSLKNMAVSIDISIYLLLAGVLLFLIHWILYNFRFSVVP